MKPEDQNRLLKDVLAGEELSDFRHTSLDCTLALVKRRRRQRRILRASAMACLPLLLVLVVVLHRTAPQPKVEHHISTPPVELNRVKFISDKELFALFPGHSMALIGKPGYQQFVFLDKPAATERP